jgi:hypothetical protein
MDHEDSIEDEFPKFSNLYQKIQTDFEKFIAKKNSHLNNYRETFKKLERELVLLKIPIPIIETDRDTYLLYFDNYFHNYFGELSWLNKDGYPILEIFIKITSYDIKLGFYAVSRTTTNRLPYNRDSFCDFVEFLRKEYSRVMDMMDDKEE